MVSSDDVVDMMHEPETDTLPLQGGVDGNSLYVADVDRDVVQPETPGDDRSMADKTAALEG